MSNSGETIFACIIITAYTSNLWNFALTIPQNFLCRVVQSRQSDASICRQIIFICLFYGEREYFSLKIQPTIKHLGTLKIAQLLTTIDK